MTAVMTGLETLQKALPQLPMGSPLHASVLKAISDIGKHMEHGGANGGDPAAKVQMLLELMRNAKMNPAAPPAMPPGGAPSGGAPPPPNMGASAPPA